MKVLSKITFLILIMGIMVACEVETTTTPDSSPVTAIDNAGESTGPIEEVEETEESLSPQAVVLVANLHIRQGPGTSYQSLGTLRRDEVVTVIGRSTDGNWWKIICPIEAQECWTSAKTQYTSSSDTNNVPIVEPSTQIVAQATTNTLPQPTAIETLPTATTEQASPTLIPTSTPIPPDPPTATPIPPDPPTSTPPTATPIPPDPPTSTPPPPPPTSGQLAVVTEPRIIEANDIGEEVEVRIRFVGENLREDVQVAQVIAYFDPRYLEVVNIRNGTALELVLIQSSDNDLGSVEQHGGTFAEDPPDPPYDFFIVTLRTKQFTSEGTIFQVSQNLEETIVLGINAENLYAGNNGGGTTIFINE